jgi:hypothetical protein
VLTFEVVDQFRKLICRFCAHHRTWSICASIAIKIQPDSLIKLANICFSLSPISLVKTERRHAPYDRWANRVAAAIKFIFHAIIITKTNVVKNENIPSYQLFTVIRLMAFIPGQTLAGDFCRRLLKQSFIIREIVWGVYFLSATVL